MASSTAPVAAVPAEGSELPAAVAGDAAATPAAPVVPEAEWPSAPPVAPSPVPVSAPSASVARTQFRVVPRAPLLPLRQDPNLPPRVITLAEIEAAKLAASDLQLVDAQAVARDEPEDPQMAAFQSMLSDYLKRKLTDHRPEPSSANIPSRADKAPDRGRGRVRVRPVLPRRERRCG